VIDRIAQWHAQNSGGLIDECRLDPCKAFHHLAFDFAAWPCQPFVVIATPLFQSRFETIGSVSHAMSCAGTE
jgi:hypothetical protein